MLEKFEIPEAWKLSPQQALIIGSLADEPGRFISPEDFCKALWPDRRPETKAPARLRVLMQRCRELIVHHAQDKSDIQLVIVSKRNNGYMMPRTVAAELRKIVANL